MSELVLSLFPGIDLLGRAFEEEGFCVVRGPDLLWGGQIETFHPPDGVFAGIIGGPPCVGESKLAHLPHGNPGYSLVHEFERCVAEAEPDWWVMEAVISHPAPYRLKCSPRYIGEMQSRQRWFMSNVPLDISESLVLFEHPTRKSAVTGMHGGKNSIAATTTYTVPEMCELQGLPRDYMANSPFTVHGQRKVIGNGVPVPMGRAIAKAIRRALADQAAPLREAAR